MTHETQDKKSKLKDFMEAIPPLVTRQTLSSDIIANNKSYGRVANRITPAQARAYEQGMRDYGLEYNQHITLTSTIGNTVMQQYEKIILDIGFGSGQALCAMARQHPNYLFVGIETYKPSVGSLFLQCDKYNITNIRVFHHDAVPVLFHMCEENVIDRIQVFFPDPWRKHRHIKRRLIQKRFLQLCLHILKKDAVIWIVSDWEEYAQQIDKVLALFEKNEYHAQATNPQYHFKRDNALNATLEHDRNSTRYEEKGIAKGHKIYSISCVKKSY